MLSHREVWTDREWRCAATYVPSSSNNAIGSCLKSIVNSGIEIPVKTLAILHSSTLPELGNGYEFKAGHEVPPRVERDDLGRVGLRRVERDG